MGWGCVEFGEVYAFPVQILYYMYVSRSSRNYTVRGGNKVDFYMVHTYNLQRY